MNRDEIVRTGDIREQLVEAIRRYLDHHFPGTVINHGYDAHTGNLMFDVYAGDDHSRLEVTERYLGGEQGTDIPIQQLTDWNVAELLLTAKERLVRLDTTGARVGPPESASEEAD